jgi:hypothetical protein
MIGATEYNNIPTQAITETSRVIFHRWEKKHFGMQTSLGARQTQTVPDAGRIVKDVPSAHVTRFQLPAVHVLWSQHRRLCS